MRLVNINDTYVWDFGAKSLTLARLNLIVVGPGAADVKREVSKPKSSMKEKYLERIKAPVALMADR